MDLATARTLATLSVPEAGELLGLGRDASWAAAHRGEIPTLAYGRRRRVPCAPLLAQLGQPLDGLDGAHDLSSTEPSTATVHVLHPAGAEQ